MHAQKERAPLRITRCHDPRTVGIDPGNLIATGGIPLSRHVVPQKQLEARERSNAVVAAAAVGRKVAERRASAKRHKIEVAYYRAEEFILVDREYLVRGLPAKILRKILLEHRDEKRTEFTTRLLRLDKSFNLPDFKDNLESRLIFLRRRLEERCPEIRIVPSGRGRFRLELEAEINFIEQDQ